MNVLKLTLGTALVFASLSTSAFAAPADKLNVCHRTDSDGIRFHVINIPAAALSDHRAHGDIVAPPAGSTAGARVGGGQIYVLDFQCNLVYIATE